MTDSKSLNVLKAKEDLLKSPEQLEQEKREIISSRLVRLDLDGKTRSDLTSLVQQFYETLLNLHSQIYDFNERLDSQKYQMMELAERARQIEKGNVKNRKSNIVHTGLGGSVLPTSEMFPQAPQKISLFSRYERVTDRRTFKDRRDLWAIQKVKQDFIPAKPKAKLKETQAPKNQPKQRRTRNVPEQPKEEDTQVEENPVEETKAEEETAEQEEQPAEEAPAEEAPEEEEPVEDAPAEEQAIEEEEE